MILLRKPLLFLLVLACGASLAGGGRLSLRLLLDTATTLAPVVLFQVVALAAVYWTGRRPIAFTPAVDAYFAGSGPWFAAVAVMGLFGAFASPVVAAQWFTRIAALAVIAAMVACIRLDFFYFRDVLGRARERAIADLLVQRLVGWGATIAYLIGSSVPKIGSFLPNVAASLFGARP